MSLTKDTTEDPEDIIRDRCESGEEEYEITEEFIGSICRNCRHFHVDMVGHPGGSSVHSVEERKCLLGFWEDDF